MQVNLIGQKVKNHHVLNGLSGNDYGVVTLPKSYLIVIIMQSLISIGQFQYV